MNLAKNLRFFIYIKWTLHSTLKHSHSYTQTHIITRTLMDTHTHTHTYVHTHSLLPNLRDQFNFQTMWVGGFGGVTVGLFTLSLSRKCIHGGRGGWFRVIRNYNVTFTCTEIEVYFQIPITYFYYYFEMENKVISNTFIKRFWKQRNQCFLILDLCLELVRISNHLNNSKTHIWFKQVFDYTHNNTFTHTTSILSPH